MTDPIPPHIWRLSIVIAFSAFMSGLDASVVNVGLDTVARDLHADLASAQWIANAYLLALAVSLPATGWLGRRIGVGRVWLGALAAFTAASGLCALAPTVDWLIALRVVQGLAAGVLIPSGQTILGQAVGPERLGRVMATLGIVVTAAPALGPIVGGVLIDNASWPWLFLVNLPVGLAAWVIGRRLVPRGEAADIGPLDRTGLVLLTAGLPLAVYGATHWGERRTLADAGVALPLLAGLAALVAYTLHSRRSARPVLDLGLYANRAYAAASATNVFTGAALFGAALLFPLYFQLGRGEGPLQTGVLLLPMALGSMLALPLSGRLVDRRGGGPVCVLGCVGLVLTTTPFALLHTDANGVVIQALLFVRGIAVALAAVPAISAAYKAVSRDQLPDATTQVNILSRLGGALGGALFAVVLSTRLPSGADAAFHATFWWLTVNSGLALVAAAWLTKETHDPNRDHHRQHPARTAQHDRGRVGARARTRP